MFFVGFMFLLLIWCFCCVVLVDWLWCNILLFWYCVSYVGCGVFLFGLVGLVLCGL